MIQIMCIHTEKEVEQAECGSSNIRDEYLQGKFVLILICYIHTTWQEGETTSLAEPEGWYLLRTRQKLLTSTLIPVQFTDHISWADKKQL